MLSTLAFLGVLVGLVWLGWRYEPHWCAKDGKRFTARTRALVTDRHLRADATRNLASPRATMFGAFGGSGAGPTGAGRQWRDARVFVDDDVVQLITRVGPLRRPLPPAKVIARGQSTNRRRAVYLIDGDPMRELRVPTSSRAVAVLDELVARSTGNPPPA